MEHDQEQAAEQQEPDQKTEQQEQAEQQAPADRHKAEIAGLNRKIAELQKQVKETSMTAEQKAEAARQEKAQLEKETINLRRSLAIEKGLAEHNLPQDFAGRVQGETPDEINQDIQSLRAFVDGLVQENMQSEINTRLAGKPPKGGESSPAMSYDDIAQVKDYKERMRLYRQNGYIK